MCGIAGMVLTSGQRPSLAELQKMGSAIAHRGPDQSGQWRANNVGLAHQRLSILDLSTHGRQPMVSADGRFALAFNGEVYNFETLRAQLPPHHYHGGSDTEVLLQALIHWGVTRTVAAITGMFAFAFVDTQADKLWLVRDRLGIKPLYYGWSENRFVFASELHSIEAVASERPTVDPASVALMLRHNHVPAPYSIYKGIQKLPPATILEASTDDCANHRTVQLQTFWKPLGLETFDDGSDAQWQERLHARLRDAVRDRLVSDVPLGGFLSGGIDSTLIVALMQEQSSTTVSTYTIGFHDARLDEASYAAATAQHLGTKHHELYVSEQHVLDAVSRLPAICDEPFADQSILPTFLLCNMARNDVTVALTGDGGDELFWGYSRYPARERLDRMRRSIPAWLRPASAAVLGSSALAKLVGAIPTPAFLGRASRLGDKLSMAAELLQVEDENETYRYLMSHWKHPSKIVRDAIEPQTLYSHPPDWVRALPPWRRMCVLDLLAYLPNDCLTKVDRASMAVGLEARVPLLDHRVVGLAYQLPEHLVRDGVVGKVLLRRILDDYVPRQMMERPKAGFGVPLASWLRGPLRDWSHDLLRRERLERQGVFNPDPVLKLLAEHQNGTADWSAYLWDVLMFCAWDEPRA